MLFHWEEVAKADYLAQQMMSQYFSLLKSKLLTAVGWRIKQFFGDGNPRVSNNYVSIREKIAFESSEIPLSFHFRSFFFFQKLWYKQQSKLPWCLEETFWPFLRDVGVKSEPMHDHARFNDFWCLPFDVFLAPEWTSNAFKHQKSLNPWRLCLLPAAAIYKSFMRKRWSWAGFLLSNLDSCCYLERPKKLVYV